MEDSIPAVQVAVRVRPLNGLENAENQKCTIQRINERQMSVGLGQKKRTFTFDKVYSESATYVLSIPPITSFAEVPPLTLHS